MLTVLLVAMGILVCTWYYFFRRSRRRLYELAAKIPGPFDWPLIGSIHIGIGRGPTTILPYFLQFLHVVPTPMRAWFGPLLIVVIDNPEHLAVILNSQDCVKRSYVYRFLGFEKGLFNAPPDVWRKQRKLLNPSFSNAVVKRFVPTFNAKADKLAESLLALAGTGQFNMVEKAGEYTVSTTMVNSIGLDLDEDNSDYKKRYLENADKMQTLKFTRIYKAWLHPDFIYKLTPSYREEMKRVQMFQEMSRKTLELRKADRLKKSIQKCNIYRDEDNVRHVPLFIDRLEAIASESDFFDEECIIENLDTVIFASNDTSACAISTALLLLAMHPDVQERLYQEVIDAAPNDYIDYEDLAKLVYLEMVIKESMRILPVVPVFARECEKEIQVGQYTIPAGAQIMIPTIKVHWDRKIWGDHSEEFDPENFSPENCAKRHPFAFLPFTGGVRSCTGAKYAYISLKIVLAKLVKRYRLSTELRLVDLKFHASIVMRIGNGYMISIERRDGKKAS
ncbi:probable cytochrome P450 313a4 [Culex quinquefasciatus]|uniref:probable cytochrome P450 313a4 n=1 Tax=Culex quinquefasciatus TaxID=7176 RepID=UPI0018E2DD00|nr:probable cytochrome P450 313a4 [Culex quinquefasciatus]